MDITTPVPPGEVRDRLVVDRVPAGGTRFYRGRPWGGAGLRVGQAGALPMIEDRPQAYLRLVPDGDGTRVTGVVRAGWWARCLAVLAPLMVPVVVAGVVSSLGPALAEGGVPAWMRVGVWPLLVYSYADTLASNRTGKRTLRDWLAETVTAGR